MDRSEQSAAALDYLLSQDKGEKITVLHVVEPISIYGDGWSGYQLGKIHEQVVKAGEDLCAAARERAGAAGVLETTDVETVVKVGRPAATILSYAAEHDVDHIILGSHGRTGLSRLLFGSVAEAVIRRAQVPVTIVR